MEKIVKNAKLIFSRFFDYFRFFTIICAYFVVRTRWRAASEQTEREGRWRICKKNQFFFVFVRRFVQISKSCRAYAPRPLGKAKCLDVEVTALARQMYIFSLPNYSTHGSHPREE
jgi:hypothetical protein